MTKVRIVTDSTADIPVELLKQYNIEVVPLKVIFSDAVYKDWIEMEPKAFYQKMGSSPHLPTTSQPSPAEFSEVYQRIIQAGDSVISIHLSAQLSGTYQSANLGAQMVDKPEGHGTQQSTIDIIDSKQVSMALGLIVLEAAKAAQSGSSREEILALVSDLIAKVKLYFIVDTLENLQKGGRIGKASALVGALLNIKPILTLSDGIVTPFAKVRGKAKAIERIIEEMTGVIKGGQRIVTSFVHSDNPESLQVLKDRVLGSFNVAASYESEIGAVIGTHGGPGIIAVVYYPIESE